MKLFYNALLFGVCTQLFCYISYAFHYLPLNYPYGNITGLYGSGGVFSITAFSALVGIGTAAGIGIAALLLKQGVYAIFAMLLFGIGIMFNFIGNFFLAIPNTIAAFISATGLTVAQTQPFLVVLSVIFAFSAWWFMFELIVQRSDT